jgi:hypothetical protein
MSERPSKIPAANTANIVKRGGVYHLLMLVEGRWLETGITSRKFLEITRIADREFKIVHVNAPVDTPPPLPASAPAPAAAKDTSREGARDKVKAPASS